MLGLYPSYPLDRSSPANNQYLLDQSSPANNQRAWQWGSLAMLGLYPSYLLDQSLPANNQQRAWQWGSPAMLGLYMRPILPAMGMTLHSLSVVSVSSLFDISVGLAILVETNTDEGA